MRNLVLATVMFLPAAQLSGQEGVARVFELKYGDTRRIADVLRIFPNQGMVSDDSMRTITVKGSPDQLKAIEDIIKRFDVPTASQNLEFTVYLLVASADAAKAGPVPAALDPVVKQMTQTFAFKAFRLQETFILRTRDGRSAEASSIGPAKGSDGHNIIYQCKIGSARVVPDDKGKNIRIDGLRIGLRLPYRVSAGQEIKYQFADVGISSDIDVREGQKAVVGKTNLDGGETMFAVLIPKIVD